MIRMTIVTIRNSKMVYSLDSGVGTLDDISLSDFDPKISNKKVNVKLKFKKLSLKNGYQIEPFEIILYQIVNIFCYEKNSLIMMLSM